MRLKELLAEIQAVSFWGQPDLDISGIAYSSSLVEPGNIFVAIRGLKADGHDFIPEAKQKGATAIVSERQKPEELDLTWIQVPEAREALALISAAFYGHPALKLKTIGITGTKGKTTVSYILEAILQAAGLNPGVIGTVDYRWNNQRWAAPRTTPEAPDIQKILKQMVDSGVTHCVLEVSSHSLELKRVLGIGFDLAIFTNLSGEHLDYHQTMENYFEAKKKLFFLNHKRQASIVNIDDVWGQKLISELPMRTITFGFRPEALVRVESFEIVGREMKAQVSYPGGRLNFKTKLIGRHNLYNFLAAISAALVLGISPQAIVKGISQLESIPGRLEFVPNSLGLSVVVDYAHTDNALENLLLAVRSLNPARIILIFGCGGDRDRSKRPRMGEVAAHLADWTIITSDNPRSEDPEKIIKDIEQGFLKVGSKNYELIIDRRSAIQKALAMAAPGDFVVIAGKGHETYQIFKDQTLPFSDYGTALEIIKKLEEKNRMASLSLARLAELTGGKIIQGEPGNQNSGLHFRLQASHAGLFVFALKGIRDGHDYIAEARKKGAVAACVSREVRDLPADFGLIQVNDTLQALQQLAARVLAESQLRVVGITGSIGKTSTKELTARLLSARFSVLRSMGNYNNQIGLPISILSLNDSHQIAVLEMGMNHPGEIKRLVEIAPPEVAVITRIAPVHLEFFQTLEEIALAKKEILAGAKPGASAVLNGDDPLIRQIAADFPPDKIIYFGKGDRYLIRAEDIEYHGWSGLSFGLIYGQEKARVELPILNEGLITNVLAACGVAYYFGLRLAEILSSLHQLPVLAHRGEVIKLKDGTTIYDDSYNSNPVALEEVLKSLGRLQAGRKIAVLGDMLELGPAENQYHLDAGALLPAYGWDYLVTVGSQARLIAEGAVRQGLDSARVESFDRPEEAADWLKSFIRPSDLVLVKGSRGLSLEIVVENLKRERED